jgi:hypothetical protein
MTDHIRTISGQFLEQSSQSISQYEATALAHHRGKLWWYMGGKILTLEMKNIIHVNHYSHTSPKLFSHNHHHRSIFRKVL